MPYYGCTSFYIRVAGLEHLVFFLKNKSVWIKRTCVGATQEAIHKLYFFVQS